MTLPSEQWRDIATKVEASTNSTVALMELNALDEQDQRELDRLELGEFRRQQKRKMASPGSEVSPKVHDRKRKRSAGESRDAEVPDYRRVVLVLRPPLVDTPGSAPLSGGRAEEDVPSSPPLGKTGSTGVPPSLSQDRSSGLPFRAIEAELPEAPLEVEVVPLLPFYFLLTVTLDPSFEAHEELDAANARAIRMRDRLEDLEETVHRYRARAHVAEELIRKYPEDEGLYEVDLPSLSSLQNQLTASEAMVRRLATFAHRLYSADPANLLHHHNTYVGGLIEAIITLLSRSLLHPPERMRTVVELALEYLSQGRLTHGKLHLRSTSSLLYYYSNAADRVDGLYQDMLTHSRFSIEAAFLAAAQHASSFLLVIPFPFHKVPFPIISPLFL
ncbi:hypothetical protein LENED_011834 [Lentinula edodes]|uniref:Uncharacterized protein n=1 Tax=Lentinula edodes TaxID=5353 RepID=A0A1Q3ER23_LENED|nr:hypothetical protein LENED_011834 [Lentinula edodes]